MKKIIAFFEALKAKLMRKHDEQSEQIAFALSGEGHGRRVPQYRYSRRHRIRPDRSQLDLFLALAPLAEEHSRIEQEPQRQLPRLLGLARIGAAMGLQYHDIAPAPLNYRGRIGGL